MNKSRFTVLFATDASYIPHLATAIYSLLKNNSDLRLKIVVFTVSLPENDRTNLEKIASDFNTPIKFELLDDSHFSGLILNHHFKKSNYYRLFAADFIPEAKCLYLDADLIVDSSIKDIISIDISDKFLAAVENPGFSSHATLGMREESKYFNSGVMLLNLEKWREVDTKNSVIDFVKKRPQAIQFVDQCGLNGVVDGNWLELDAKFNCQTYMLTEVHPSIYLGSNQPIVIHFTGSGKPWHLNNIHPYKKLYWRYRNKTVYKAYVPDDLTFANVIRFIAPVALKKFYRKIFNSFLFK